MRLGAPGCVSEMSWDNWIKDVLWSRDADEAPFQNGGPPSPSPSPLQPPRSPHYINYAAPHHPSGKSQFHSWFSETMQACTSPPVQCGRGVKGHLSGCCSERADLYLADNSTSMLEHKAVLTLQLEDILITITEIRLGPGY